MSRNRSFDCPECEGSGTVECCCCDSEIDCEECRGTGLDDEKLDVAAFQKALHDIMQGGGAWGWYEGGVMVGMQSEKRKLAFKDFARATA